MDPIHQFQINNLFPIGRIGHVEIAFTNSTVFMLLSLAIILLFMVGGTSRRALVPGRLQSTAEVFYEFVFDTLRSTAGPEGMKFFPLVFSIFMFILVLNVIGIIPYTFSVTSHIIITVAFALLVFFTVIIYGFWKNGLRFLKLFVPSRMRLHPAAGELHRGDVIPVTAGLPQRAAVGTCSLGTSPSRCSVAS